MESISYAIASADRVRDFIHAEVKATDNKVTNDQEAAESKAAKAKAVSALRSTITLVDSTLAKLRAVKKPQATGPKKSIKATEALEHTRVSAVILGRSLPDNAKSLLLAMSPDSKKGLGSQTQSLEDMANAIEPIVTSFDDVLTKPYLDNFSATLNTVPVVGLKNNQIMYLATKLDTLSKSSTKDEWTYFGSLPDGVTLDSKNNVHLFPYKGDFCISAGTAVWRRRHRDKEDPILQEAVGNWPKMYLDRWEKIGDKVLAAANLCSVVPFAVLSADRNQADFHLLILQQDGSIKMLSGDDIYPSNSWDTISYQKGDDGPAHAPNWTRMAYWNNSVVAVDDQNNTWTLYVDFKQGTYTIGDKTPIQPTTEFTATDIGPVAVQADGYLYKRFVQDPPSDGQEPSLQWTRWVKQDGVVNLGVAAPGVLLDLQVLTKTLKSRYLDTQMALYPVVNKISAFARTHDTYLDLLLKAADQWANAPDDQQAADAIAAGNGFVDHAKVWAKIMDTAIRGTKDTVNIMTDQLHDVKSQLTIQLQVLRDKLVGLKNILKAQEEALSKLQAAFWGAVAAMFLGIALGILALATGAAAFWVVGAGALFVAGFVASVALGVKMVELADQISKTNAQIDVTSTAISELSAVVQNFTDLDSMYSTLNVFWGRMFNDAVSLGDMDEATAEQLGESLLADKSSIIAAKNVSNDIYNAAQLYLDILNKQGVKIPSKSATSSVRVILPSPYQLETQLQAHVESGKAELANGNIAKYHAHMENVFIMELRRQAASITGNVHSGTWYDIPRLSSAAELINGNISKSDAGKLALDGLSTISDVIKGIIYGSSSDRTEIDNYIDTAVPVVVGMLQKTNAMCADIQDLLEKYKQYSKSGDDADIAKLKDTLLQTALDDCSSAQSYSALANNAFTDVNHACTDYQQGLECQINELYDKAKSTKARADQEKRQISVPWYVYLGGWIAIVAYTEEMKSEIENDLSAKLKQIDAAVAWLNIQEQSGASMNGYSLSWTDMVQTVSGCLGSVYNILAGVFGQVLENPTMYESLLTTEWADIQKNTTEVLNILASRGVDISSKPGTTAVVNVANQALSSIETTISRRLAAAGDNEKVVGALDAPGELGSGVAAQAKKAQDFFTEAQTLLELPYLSGIVGYWDEKQTGKTTLLDVVTKLRRYYVDMMSAEYSVIQDIYTTSLLQKTRAQLVQEGQMKLEVFVRSSLKSARADEAAASTVANKFKAAAADYQFALKQIEANLEQIKQKLAEIDKNIDDLEKQERDKIINLIGDVVALSFASALILVGLGVLGPVAEVLTAAQWLGLGATETAAAVKTVVDGLGLADIEKLLTILRSTRRDLETTSTALQAVRPLFGSVVEGAEALETATSDMADELQRLVDDIDLSTDVGLSSEDVDAIGKSWVEVKESCTLWLDVVNAQGIVPAKFL
ncbi:hypothetical protein F5X99DRAFT_424351 [Biscogniauxia marginata]|nr:hypothetical protein F5X99DRAFT_424351 [Biscogniauxia marginata]